MDTTKTLQSFKRGGKALLACLAPPPGLHMADMIAMGLIMAACYFLFMFGDLGMVSSISYTYLKGHFADFYSYNKATLQMPGYYYLQPLYLLFALWNLPLKILGLVDKGPQGTFNLPAAELGWTKLLLVVFFALCAVAVYRIARLIAQDGGQARLCMFLFASNPLTIYTIFIFAGYDFFGLALSLFGLYAYLEGRHKHFVIWFAVAVSFKYFALLPFVPLLLLKEKNLWKILRSLLAVCVPTAVCYLFTLVDPGAAGGEVFKDLGVYGDFSLNLGQALIPSTFVLTYLGMCLLAYFTHTGDDKRKFHKYAIMLTLAASLIIFLFKPWNVRWFILITPFLALAYLFTPNRTFSLLFETVGSAAMFLRTFFCCSSIVPRDWTNFLVDPSDFTKFNYGAVWANFWVNSADGYGPIRGFLQPGLMATGWFVPTKFVPYIDVFTLLYLLFPFLLLLIRRAEDAWPKPALFKTEAGYIRLRSYGGLAAYLLPVVAVSGIYTWLPALFEKMTSAVSAIR